MNLMKWRSFQREVTDVATDPSPSPLENNFVPRTHDPLDGSHSILSPPTDFVYAPVASAARNPEPLLITKDIEALLEEDARRRRSNESDSGRSRSPFSDSSVDWSGNAAPLVGLPAPPRGPRKIVHRERVGRRRPRQEAFLRKVGSVSSGELFTIATSPPNLFTFANAMTERTPTSEVPNPLRTLQTDERQASTEADATLQTTKQTLPSNCVNDANGQDTRMQTDSSDSNISRPMLASSAADHVLDVPEDVSSSLGNRSDIFGLHEDREFEPHRIPPRDPWSSATTSRAYLLPVSAARVPSDTRQTARPLLKHEHHNSADSDFSHSTFSSHDPPSTAYEPRISISSTIYPPSTCDSSLLRNAFQIEDRRLEEEQRTSSLPSYSTPPEAVSNVHPSFGSIIDLASTSVSPNAEALPLPQFADPDETSSDRNTHRTSSFSARDDELNDSQISIPPRAFIQRSVSANGRPMRYSNAPNPSLSPKLSSLIPYNLLTSFSHTESASSDYRPPTTNYLNAQERSELVRKNRKLTQVFGETPSPMSGPEDLLESPLVTNCLLPMIPSKRSHSRGASALSDAGLIYTNVQLMPCAREDKQKTASPLSPMTFRSSYLLNEDEDEDESPSPYESPAAQTPRSPKLKAHMLSEERPDQRIPAIEPSDSFIDLTDAEMRGPVHSESTLSLPLDDDKEERRRKRERLAKLHRFLGSRIPAELVLGPHEMGSPLPDVAPSSLTDNHALSDGETTPSLPSWIPRRRRSSLSSSLPAHWLVDERRKEHLSDKEKALRVKRANKMEKMFGEQPPQSLFHRAPPSAFARSMADNEPHARSAPSSPVGRNINKSAYRKTKSRKSNRPGTAESSKGLLGSRGGASVDIDHVAGSIQRKDGDSAGPVMSEAYLHYRHSLISLTDIVNRDDRESLAELHEYLNTDHATALSEHRAREFDYRSERSRKPTLREERRRSLPQQSSSTSLASQYTAADTKPEATTFTIRRRRAAKLSQFFGVSYRDLFGDVLESIEMGVREDGGRGTLMPDEVQDLLAQLKTLQVRRDEFS